MKQRFVMSEKIFITRTRTVPESRVMYANCERAENDDMVVLMIHWNNRRIFSGNGGLPPAVKWKLFCRIQKTVA